MTKKNANRKRNEIQSLNLIESPIHQELYIPDYNFASTGLTNIALLVKVANELDSKRLFGEADAIDDIIIALADQSWSEWLGQKGQQAGSFVGSGIDRVQSGVTNVAQNAARGAGYVAENAGRGAQYVAENAARGAGYVAENAAKGAQYVASQVSQEIKNIATSIGLAAEQLTALVSKYGKQAVEQAVSLASTAMRVGRIAANQAYQVTVTILTIGVGLLALPLIVGYESGKFLADVVSQALSRGVAAVKAAVQRVVSEVNSKVIQAQQAWTRFRQLLGGAVQSGSQAVGQAIQSGGQRAGQAIAGTPPQQVARSHQTVKSLVKIAKHLESNGLNDEAFALAKVIHSLSGY